MGFFVRFTEKQLDEKAREISVYFDREYTSICETHIHQINETNIFRNSSSIGVDRYTEPSKKRSKIEKRQRKEEEEEEQKIKNKNNKTHTEQRRRRQQHQKIKKE